LASAALTAVENFLDTFMTQWAVLLPLVDFTLSFAMTTLLFAMIYKYIPRERLAWSDVWTGAAVTALLFTIGKFLQSTPATLSGECFVGHASDRIRLLRSGHKGGPTRAPIGFS
jgi:uncharacterized BrkB/YihY/UPF0761 family membrane protein